MQNPCIPSRQFYEYDIESMHQFYHKNQNTPIRDASSKIQSEYKCESLDSPSLCDESIRDILE